MKTLLALALALPMLAAGCDDFATPSELEAPRIIALAAEPAAVAPGGEAVLDAVVAGPTGLMGGRARWSIETPVDGVSLWSDGVDHISVAAGVGETEVTLRAEVEVGGDVLIGVRQIAVGGASRGNPVIDLVVGGAAAGEALVLDAGIDHDIALLADPAPESFAAGAVSWFATAGEIPHYRHNPAVLEAPGEPGAGVLLAVYRDGQGGVAWRQWPLTFE